jgi:hypothetical protein
MAPYKWDIDVSCAFGWSNMVDGTYVGIPKAHPLLGPKGLRHM